MIRILPSVLVHSRSALAQRLRAIGGRVAYAHLDVANRTLVPSRTFHTPAAISALGPRVRFDVHLMTRLAPAMVRRWHRPWVWRITFHPEATANPLAVLAAIRRMGKRTAVAVSPDLPLATVLPLLDHADGVLVMGVRPGWSGQRLLPATLRRLRTLRQRAPRLPITFDGGVNTATIRRVIAAGATQVVVGSALPNEHFTAHLRNLTRCAHAKT